MAGQNVGLERVALLRALIIVATRTERLKNWLVALLLAHSLAQWALVIPLQVVVFGPAEAAGVVVLLK